VIGRLWRAFKRELLLGDIVAYQERLATIEAHGLHHYDPKDVALLRGLLALARARLASEEFNPTKAIHEPV